ncbi:MAG: hypothetical protein GY767_22395, partial [Shimia sp.]|nr:hypothetical protein [Shimia sp.]
RLARNGVVRLATAALVLRALHLLALVVVRLATAALVLRAPPLVVMLAHVVLPAPFFLSFFAFFSFFFAFFIDFS